MNQAKNMNFNNIFLDNIAKSSVLVRQKENVSDSYMSLIRYFRSKNEKSHTAKIEEYILRIYVEMNPQHLKQNYLQK